MPPTDMQPQQKQRKIIVTVMKVLIPMIVTVGLCYLMFSKIDYHDMLRIIREQCTYGWVLAALGISVFSHVVRAMRWGIQLRALGIKVPLFILTLSVFGTYSINLLFPRLGELWRTSYIAARQRAPFSTVFGSMLAERTADSVTVLLITIVTACFGSAYVIAYLSENDAAYLKMIAMLHSPWFWAAIAAAVLLCAVAWRKLRRPGKEGTPVARIQGFLRGIWQGFAVVAKMKGKWLWVFLSLALWGIYFLQTYVAFYSFPFTRHAMEEYGIMAPLVTFVLGSIAMGVPSNGGIGPWQWAEMFALGLFGVASIDGLAFGNLLMGSQTVCLILLGLFTFIVIMFDKRRSKQAASGEQPHSPESDTEQQS